jgi:Acetokinase family
VDASVCGGVANSIWPPGTHPGGHWSTEHNPAVRAAAAGGLGFLGITVDPGRNHATADAIISDPDAETPCLVVTAREDVEIAQQARDVLIRPVYGAPA